MVKKAKQKKEQLIKKVAEELQFPDSAMTNTYRIEFRGTTDVIVEGCRGIVEYRDDCIALNLGKRIISFSGKKLELENFLDGYVQIKGEITSTEFSS